MRVSFITLMMDAEAGFFEMMPTIPHIIISLKTCVWCLVMVSDKNGDN